MSKAKQRRLIFIYLVLLGVLTLLGVNPAGATIYVVSDTRKLAERSDVILLGHVEKTATRWDAGKIITEATVRVEDPVKGAPRPTVLVLQPGGQVGDIVMRVLGAPEFHTGDRSILFLKRVGTALRVIGLGQGKLDVQRTRGGAEIVSWTLEGAAAVSAVPLSNALVQLRRWVQKP